MDITQIVIAVIGLCIAILTVVVVPKIKAQVGEDKFNEALAKAETFKYYAKIAVTAAEQMFPEDSTKKLQEASNFMVTELSKVGLTVNLDEVRNYIEDCVLNLHKDLRSQS